MTITTKIKNALAPFPTLYKFASHSKKLFANSKPPQNERIYRSPALSKENNDFLTERLLSHPALIPLPETLLVTHQAKNNSRRQRICSRLIEAYLKAVEDEKKSPMQREGSDLWSDLLKNELPELMAIIYERDANSLSEYLMQFGSKFVWFGGITTCIDGYNQNLDPNHVALTYHDKLVCLAEYLGCIKFENPEFDNWGKNLQIQTDEILQKIADQLEIDITPPLGAIHTDGVKTKSGVFHYRHINSLYSAIRIKELNRMDEPCLEIGGGLGITALYAARLGLKNYTLLDLPITCLLAGNYLLNSLDEQSVCLYGEKMEAEKIKLLPYWECENLPSNYFNITFNQDSFPEMADNLILKYLEEIKRVTTDSFLSINHEALYPRTVHNFVKGNSHFVKAYRSKYWIREGHLEELWKIKK